MKGSSINTPKGRALVSTEILLQNSQVIQFNVSIPRRVERSFLLQHLGYFIMLFHFYPHILPFFHLRASQKIKFRRRCSHFSFL